MSTAIDTDNLTYDDALALVREVAAEYADARGSYDRDPLVQWGSHQRWGARQALEALVVRLEHHAVDHG